MVFRRKSRPASRHPTEQCWTIALTAGFYALVDDEDVELANRVWQVNAKGYATRIETIGGRTLVVMHREVARRQNGFLDPSMQVDHINGDRRDNRRSNLRICTQNENAKNLGRYRNNTSGFKGVSFHKRCRKWQASIQVDGQLRYLGLYDTLEAAAAVYETVARAEFGSFYRTETGENKMAQPFLPDLDAFKEKMDKGFRFDQVTHKSQIGFRPADQFLDRDEMRKLRTWSENFVRTTYDFNADKGSAKVRRKAKAPKVQRKPQLNKVQIAEVLGLLASDMSCEDIAVRYCCSASTIRRVRRQNKFKEQQP